MNSSPFSPVSDCCFNEDIENQEISNKDIILTKDTGNKSSLPPPLLPFGDRHQSILKASSKENIFKSPLSSRSLKVTFQTPARTPKAVKSFSPSVWSALRDLDDQERWVERTSVVTKQDHEDYILLASEFLEEIINNLPVCQETYQKSAAPVQLQPVPAASQQSDLLLNFTDTISAADKPVSPPAEQHTQTEPNIDPFSPQRQENHMQEELAKQEPVKEITEQEAGPSIDLPSPGKEENKENLKEEVTEPTDSKVDSKEAPEVLSKEPVSVDTAEDTTQPTLSESTGPAMEEVTPNIYDDNFEGDPFASKTKVPNSPPLPRSSGYNINFDAFDETSDPFGTTKQLANSPPKTDPFASTKQLANSPPKTDPLASTKQLANSPPKTDPFASTKQLANSPPKTDPFASTKQLANSPPKTDPFASTKQLANSPPQTSPLQNKKPATKRKSPLKASPKKEEDSSTDSATTTPNGEMNTTPSPDTDGDVAEVVDTPAVVLPGVDSEGNTSPTTDDYVDALQEPEIITEPEELVSNEVMDEFGTGDEDFRPATEVFASADPAAFDIDFLEKAGGNSNFKESALARQSLYVKFDPLVNAAGGPGGPVNGMPVNIQHNKTILEDDLLQMQTPPKGKVSTGGRLKHPAAVAAAKKAIAAQHEQSPVGVDKLLAYSPPMNKQESSKAETAVSPRNITSPSSGNSQEDIVQVLRYSQADLQNAVKAAREAEKKAAKAEKEAYEEDKRELLKQMADKDQTIANMKTSNEELRGLVTEYEKAMQEMMGDMNKVKDSQDSRVTDIQKEKDQALEDLASVEGAFSDLHRRYEKIKQVVESLKKNELILKDCVNDYKTKLTKQEQKYHTLKTHAEGKIEKANSEIDKVKSSYEAEITGLQAAVKRGQMEISSLEKQIEQKTRDNAELTKICDELIAKMGSARS
ncbi:uncharacterized protein [Amphiura filiformis]|uniref:uncharacterized protein isoform X2 n=1 Tax=Amphiura filiformis TaxID=82378 RepID=UPI003B218D28